MPNINHDMQTLREGQEKSASIRKCRQEMEVARLIELCGTMPLYQLPNTLRQQICRSVDTANAFAGLAYVLGEDSISVGGLRGEAGGRRGPTELLMDYLDQKGVTVHVSVLLRHFGDKRLHKLVREVGRGVEEARAISRQRQLHREVSNGDQMDSGYSSVNGSCPMPAVRAELPLVGSSSTPPPSPSPPPPPPPPPPPGEARNRGPRVMLTYTADGYETALMVAGKLNNLHFRVMLLEEQRRWREPNSYTAVQKWFEQMHYVLPVLTPQYLAATQNLAEPGNNERAARLIADARFVYSLMATQLEQKYQHINWRVRAVVANDVVESIRQHPLYGTPLFRWPYLVSELDDLVECLIA